MIPVSTQSQYAANDTRLCFGFFSCFGCGGCFRCGGCFGCGGCFSCGGCFHHCGRCFRSQ
ncbi:hypothetical protein P4S95_19160 [Aneurinibacillus aneurinilyticus]|nr:hypothetical protein [Aneurinibacillus aneurinilyticus]